VNGGKAEDRRQKAEDKGISPQRHEDQHKGPQRRQKDKAEERVQKAEVKEQKENKGGRADHTAFVSFVLSAFCLQSSVFFLVSLSLSFCLLCGPLC
jgi:hypothetical protein